MAYQPAPVKTWNRSTAADGLLLNDEFNQIYQDIETYIAGNGGAAPTKTLEELNDEKMNINSNGTYYINSQIAFTAIIEQVSGNQYKFKDTVLNVILEYISGGYQMPSDNNYLQTNNCKSIEMRGGAFFDFNAGTGYLEFNTDDCYLKNVHVQGNGSSGAVVQSFLLNASRVTFDNCKCSTRLSSVAMVGFQGSSTAVHNITSKYINCSVHSLDGASTLYGFNDCYNLQNCLAYDLDSTPGIGVCYGFNACHNLSTCYAYQIDADSGSANGFTSCFNLASCTAEDISHIGNTARGFASCFNLSACYAYNINTGNGTDTASGFIECYNLSACYAYQIDGGNAYGFYGCDQLSSCWATDIDSTTNNARGFSECSQISACKASAIASVSGIASGFDNCEYGAALFTDEAVNASNDFIDTTDAQVTNKVSCPAVFT